MIFFFKHAVFKEVDKTNLENKFLWWHNKCNDDDCRRVTAVVVLMLNDLSHCRKPMGKKNQFRCTYL